MKIKKGESFQKCLLYQFIVLNVKSRDCDNQMHYVSPNTVTKLLSMLEYFIRHTIIMAIDSGLESMENLLDYSKIHNDSIFDHVAGLKCAASTFVNSLEYMPKIHYLDDQTLIIADETISISQLENGLRAGMLLFYLFISNPRFQQFIDGTVVTFTNS